MKEFKTFSWFCQKTIVEYDTKKFYKYIHQLILITVTLHEHHGVPNHRQIDSLFKHLVQLNTKERSKLHVTSVLWWPLKDLVMRKWVLCHDVMMFIQSHYSDVIIGATASQITRQTIVYSTVYSGADQRKHQSSASLAFVRRNHRRPVKFSHKRPVTRKMFPFDDIIMV